MAAVELNANIPQSEIIKDIDFLNIVNCTKLVYSAGILYAFSEYDQYVYKSTNEGATWTSSVPFPNAFSDVKFVGFVDGINGLCVVVFNNNWYVRHTTNGATTWNYVGGIFDGPVAEFAITGTNGTDMVGYFSTPTSFYRWDSVNGFVQKSTTNAPKPFSFISSTTGYGVMNGLLYKTTDEGATWTYLGDPNLSNNTTIMHVKSSTEIFVGDIDEVKKTHDEGTTWITLNIGKTGSENIIAIKFKQDFAICVTTATTYVSYDNGFTWKADAIAPNAYNSPNSSVALP